MGTRLDLHNKLVEIFESKNVYYQPPTNLKMEYPAIRYSVSSMSSMHGDNMKYSNRTCYDVIVIDRLPDNKAIKKILELPYSSFDRHYVSDNLNHDLIKLYF